MSKRTAVWFLLLVGLAGWAQVRPARAYLVDEDLGGYCPECFSDPSCAGVDQNCTYGSDNLCCSGVPMSECEGQVDDPTACRTSGPDAWIYTFKTACLKCTNPLLENCKYTYEYETKDCSASDRCEDPSVGNSSGACGGDVAAGTNENGRILT